MANRKLLTIGIGSLVFVAIAALAYHRNQSSQSDSYSEEAWPIGQREEDYFDLNSK